MYQSYIQPIKSLLKRCAVRAVVLIMLVVVRTLHTALEAAVASLKPFSRNFAM